MSRNKLQKVLDIKFIIAVIIIILLCAVLVYTRKEAKSNYVSDEKITEEIVFFGPGIVNDDHNNRLWGWVFVT